MIDGFFNCLDAFCNKVEGIEDVTLIIMADNSHVTVEKDDMVILLDEVL